MDRYDEDRVYRRKIRREESRLRRNKQLVREYTLLAIAILSVVLIVTGALK